MGLTALDPKGIVDAKVLEWDFTRPMQRIRKLAIKPQPTSAIFTYRTNQPTVPVVEIFQSVSGNPVQDMVPANVVATGFDFISAWLGNLTDKHQAVMTGLASNRRFHYRITAGDGTFPAAIVTGTFMTSARVGRFTIRTIFMFNDGDPGLKGEGEFVFDFGFYNDKDLIGVRQFKDDIDSGETRDFPLGRGATLESGAIQDQVSVFVHGVEHDSDILGSFTGGPELPTILPETTVAFENDDKNVAEALQTLNMPQDPGEYRFNFRLDSGPRGIHYWVDGWVEITLTPPQEAPVIPPDLITKLDGIKAMVTLSGVGKKAGIGGKDAKTHGFALGPEGALFRRLPGQAWARIDEGPGARDVAHSAVRDVDCACDMSATIARDAEDRIHLVTLQSGVLRWASYAAGGRSTGLRWRDMGAGFKPGLTIADAADGTPLLFARDEGNALRATALAGPGLGKWVDLGGNFAGAVTVLAGRSGVEIFGVTPDGLAQTARWRPGAARPPAWSPLGRPGYGRSGRETRFRHVDVAGHGSRAMAIALTTDRQLLTLTASEGWSGAWKDQGSLDTWGAPRVERKPAGKKAPSKRRKAAR